MQGKLDDITMVELDTAIALKDRAAYLLGKLKDPRCFTIDGIRVNLSFTETASDLHTHMLSCLNRHLG